MPAAIRPILFLINFRRFGQFADKDVLEALGPRMAERGRLKESDLFEQATEAFRYNGTLMCIPQNVSSLVVYYNRTLFEQARRAAAGSQTGNGRTSSPRRRR